MMRRWIVFRADKRQPGWQDRKYAHTGSLTKTLAEHYDCRTYALTGSTKYGVWISGIFT